MGECYILSFWKLISLLFFLGGGVVLFQLCEYMIFLILETEIVILDNFGRCFFIFWGLVLLTM